MPDSRQSGHGVTSRPNAGPDDGSRAQTLSNVSSNVKIARSWADPGWLERYAREAARLKGLPEDDATLHSAIRRGFHRFYRAVAFDIDGTLTAPEGGVVLAPELIPIIRDLLIRGVPVVLITGRSAESARSAALALRRDPAITDPYLRLLYVIAHNGTTLLSTTGQRPDDLLQNSENLDPNLATEWLSGAVQLIEARMEKLGLARDSARVREKTHALRLEFADAAERERARVWVRELIPDSRVRISGGQYGTTFTIDVVGTTKAEALERLAAKIGVPPEGILRVGDAGAEGGNDYELLDSGSGFTVGTLSSSAEGCFPVLNETADAQLSGEAATRALLKLVYLGPPIRVEAPPAGTALRQAAEFEVAARSRANEEFAMLTARVRRRTALFLRHDARPVPGSAFRLADLYDPRSGGVRLTDAELVALDMGHPAVTLFELDRLEGLLGSVPKLRRCMYTDSEVLLRGPEYYYAQVEPEAKRTAAEYLPVAEGFLEAAVVAIERLGSEAVDAAKLKLTLAIFDNVRNILLNVLALQSEGIDDRAVADFYASYIVAHTDLHIELLLGTFVWQQVLDEYVKLLRGIGTECVRLRTASPAGTGKMPRYREADDFLLNVLAIEIAVLELYPRGALGKDVVAVGIASGGNELPAIATVLGNEYGFNLVPALMLGVRTYGNREMGDRVRQEAYDFAVAALEGGWVRIVSAAPQDLAEMRGIICDDNCTTGTTLELARDILVVQGVEVIGAAIVRWPGFNRRVHQTLPRHGVAANNLLLGFVRGLVAPNTYARLIVPGSSETGFYEDETRTFDKSKARIQRYLLKNGTPRAEE